MRFVAILLAVLLCSAVGHAQSMTSRLTKIDDTAALNAAVSDIGKLSAKGNKQRAALLTGTEQAFSAAIRKRFDVLDREHR
jgi:hypothetical protein